MVHGTDGNLSFLASLMLKSSTLDTARDEQETGQWTSTAVILEACGLVLSQKAAQNKSKILDPQGLPCEVRTPECHGTPFVWA